MPLLLIMNIQKKSVKKTSENNIFYRKEKKFNFLELMTFIYDI